MFSPSQPQFSGEKKSLIPKDLFNQLYGNNETDTALENLYEMTVKILDEAILHSQPISLRLSPASFLSVKKCIKRRQSTFSSHQNTFPQTLRFFEKECLSFLQA